MQEERIYSLFPEFRPFMVRYQAELELTLAHLRTLDRAWVAELVGGIAPECQASNAGPFGPRLG